MFDGSNDNGAAPRDPCAEAMMLCQAKTEALAAQAHQLSGWLIFALSMPACLPQVLDHMEVTFEAVEQQMRAMRDLAKVLGDAKGERLMELDRFLNALKIMRSIDQDEFTGAGLPEMEWKQFCDHPLAWFLAGGEVYRHKLWALVEGRQPKRAAMRIDISETDCSTLMAALAAYRLTISHGGENARAGLIRNATANGCPIPALYDPDIALLVEKICLQVPT